MADRDHSAGQRADPAPYSSATSLPSQAYTAGIPTRLAVLRLRQRGIALSPLLRKARLSAAHLDTPDARFGAASQVAFLELASAALGEPFLGFILGRDFDLRQIGLLYYAAASSSTLGGALDRAQRYGSIVNEGIALECARNGDLRIAVRHSGVTRRVDRQQVEFLVTTIVHLCRTLTNRKLVPRAVRMVHQRADDPAKFESFLGVRITFGAGTDEIIFDREVRQLLLVGADPYLNEMLQRYCEEALSARHSHVSPLRVAVENALTPLLPHGRAQIGVIAPQLDMSGRTLARRLAAEGLNFAEILDQLRAALASRYLEEGRLCNSQIAWLVGYRGVSAFTHACRRWTGMTPGQFRRGKHDRRGSGGPPSARERG